MMNLLSNVAVNSNLRLYLSVDVYLPDHDVALECDGPTHFISTSFEDGGEGGGSPGGEGGEWSGRRRTLSTELRDMFLAR